MGDESNAMFAPLATMISYEYASEHSGVLIQTPEWKERTEVNFIEIIEGAAAAKVTEFFSYETYADWYNERLTNATVVINDSVIEKTYSLATCSYNYLSNERTVVYVGFIP